jgi:hypothetical protein
LLGKTLKLGALALAFVLVALPGAQAEDPPFVDWASLVPPVGSPYNPDSPKICIKGNDNCVHSVIREMERRFVPLSDSCDHDALFAVTYLRTTEEYHRFWHEGPFEDLNWLDHYDAVFASYYFTAQDDYSHGRPVPGAWKVAFDAAKQQQVTALGNAFLGMNAHINRDLPFVLESIGLTAEDGTSRKADHNTVNQFLNRVSDELYPEVARRYDPTFDDGGVPGTFLDDMASFQLIPAWRELAWRNAERLTNAKTPADRAQVVQQIESLATTQAQAIVAATKYNALSSQSVAQRNAYCALHHDDV